MFSIVWSFLLAFSIAHGETTNNAYWGRTLKPARTKRTGVQTRTAPERVAPVTSNNRITIQVRKNYTKTTNHGSRSNAITSRGGLAAAQVCGGPIEIVDRRGTCRELDYDRDFLNMFQNEGLACAKEAGRSAFGFTPTKFKFRTGEGQVSATRYSSNGKLSTHAVGRALDVFDVEVYNGSAHNSVSMDKSDLDKRSNREFYTKFRDCWKRAVVKKRSSVGGSYGSGCLDFNHANHHDHMHISLPPRDANRRRYNLNST